MKNWIREHWLWIVWAAAVAVVVILYFKYTN